MSFLDKYSQNHRLEKINSKTKKNLVDLEKKLDRSINGERSFEDALKDHSDTLADLIQRVGEHFDGWKITWATAISSFRFVISIATEVYQIVEAMKAEIVTPNMSEEESAARRTQFSKDLVWFVWSAVGPLDKTFKWVPFKKTIEKRLVMWIAGMGLNAARNFFNANKEVDTFAVKGTGSHLKVI